MPAIRTTGSKQFSPRLGWLLVLAATLSLPAAATPPCVDNDVDGYVDCTTACVLQPGQTCGDCRDDDVTIHPGALETTCNGIDDDCDGLIDEDFPDGCQCSELGPGVVSWWPANGDATDIRAGHNGTLLNGTTYAAGEVGQAFHFDGVDDQVRIPQPLPATLDPGTGSFSTGGWIQTTATSGTRMILSKYECGNFCPPTAYSLYELYLTTGIAAWGLRDNTSSTVQTIVGTSHLADGGWHLVIGNRDMTASKVNLYVDGALESSSPLVPSADGPITDNDGEADPMVIGGEIIGGTNATQYQFPGSIDEVMYFNRALSLAEIQAIYAAGTAGMCPCFDDDRDGYGASAGIACAAGTQKDCEDAQPTVYPGARVLVSGLKMSANKTDLAWNAPWNPWICGIGYEVVKGDLNLLRSTGGDFTSSRGCLNVAPPGDHASDVGIPSPGDGFYYVVRYHFPPIPGCVGTFDSDSPSQVASRDAEIAASCLPCHPPACAPDNQCCIPSECCFDVASCSDIFYQCPLACLGVDPSFGHCTRDLDCTSAVCDLAGCTPSSCYCDGLTGLWVCTQDCLGHCI